VTAVVVAVEDKAVAGVNRCVDLIGTIVVERPAPIASVPEGKTGFDCRNVNRFLGVKATRGNNAKADKQDAS
jgi:hypothetical protein